MLLLTDFGSRCEPNVSGTPRSSYGEFVKTHSFGLFWPVFMLLVIDFGSRCDSNVSGNLGLVTENSSKLAVFAYSGQFYTLLLTDFGSRCDPNVSGTPGSGYVELVKTRSFCLFRPVLYAITH